MLKKLFLDYQKNPRNSIAFLKLATFLEPKIFTIFKSINCDNNYREDFIQSCHLKLLDVVNEVVFKEDATDNTISAYLERAFLTVKRDFTKTYHLYHLNISLDETDENDVPLLDKIPVIETKEVDNSDIFSQIEIVL
ncbi:MAG: hypothetical protein LBR37_01430, partial [Erysipelotrichaceae bacterium]|nr:hypothetical protein [Erysipelotrichaceae bacterium]